jgi:AAHS family benzoate transporter-like MFS transporter
MTQTVEWSGGREPATAQPGGARRGGGRRHTTLRVVVLCWIAVLLDGFDLVVLGASIPSMLDDDSWSLTGGQATMISTIGLVGMTIGAVAIGAMTDRLGRRRVLVFSVLGFSVFTLGLGLPVSVPVFALLRFLGGVALGGALPTAISLVTEFRPAGKAGSASTTVMTGYHVGAVLTALLAMFLIDAAGWHWMFVAGAVPGLVLGTVLWLFLPESPQYLRAAGRPDEAADVAASYGLSLTEPVEDAVGAAGTAAEVANPVRTLLGPTYRRNTLAIWGTSFMGLLLVYGLNTWLPEIMRQADYDLGSSLSFLLVANIGAVVGLVIAGQLSDRWSPRRTSLMWFAASAVFLALLAVRMPLLAIYAAIFLTGVFVFSSQVLVYAFTGENHPSSVRATAMGFSAGVGRLGAIFGPIMGGMLASAGLAYPWGFFAFAAVGALGAVIFACSRTLAPHQRDAA